MSVVNSEIINNAFIIPKIAMGQVLQKLKLAKNL